MPPEKQSPLKIRTEWLTDHRAFDTLSYRPRVIRASKHTYIEEDCVYGTTHRGNLQMCSQCNLSLVRSCIYSAYRPLNISSGKAHDGHGNLLLDYLDRESYLLDPDTMSRIVNPVTYENIKVIDLSKAFAVIRHAYGYSEEAA